MNVEIWAISYLADLGITNSQGHACSKANLPASILRSRVLIVGVDRIDAVVIVGYRPVQLASKPPQDQTCLDRVLCTIKIDVEQPIKRNPSFKVRTIAM